LLQQEWLEATMALRSSDTIPDLGPTPTLRIPAMADWDPEQALTARERVTAVWEDAPKTVVETPWWLRARAEGEVTRKDAPRSLGLAPAATEQDAVPMIFAPAFEVDEPTIQRFPRTPTRYDLVVIDEPADEIVPLPAEARFPRRRRPPRAWGLMFLSTLLAAALGSLAGVVARLVELLPR
jgi:hypothetical protein